MTPTIYELREYLDLRRGEAAGARRQILSLESQIACHREFLDGREKAIARLEAQIAEAEAEAEVRVEPTGPPIGLVMIANGIPPEHVRAAGLPIS